MVKTEDPNTSKPFQAILSLCQEPLSRIVIIPHLMPFPGFHPGILFHHQNSPKPEQMKMMKKWNQMEQSKRISADLC